MNSASRFYPAESVAAASVLWLGLVGNAAASVEVIVVPWNATTGLADVLGNGGSNDGVLNIVGNDNVNTLTITAVGASPDGTIATSPQSGLIVKRSVGNDAWWQNNEWMELEFSLAGTANSLRLDAAVFNWFNDNDIDRGESLMITNSSQGDAPIFTIDHSVAHTQFNATGVGYQEMFIDIPLGDTIRFSAVNTPGGFPLNTWLTRQWGFNATTPEPGDFNGNGVVDAADYTVWRDNEGQPDTLFPEGTGAGTGTVDSDDYNLWVANYGNPVDPAPAAFGVAVPEPSCLALLSLTAIVCLSERSRR